MFAAARYRANSTVTFTTGALSCMFARSAARIGASFWVLGVWPLSLALALFDRSVGDILIALLLVFFMEL
jgi:2-methylisocitrate lyase-like PEP mutase family enzyme